jgi:hypothetical protein
MFSSVLSKSKLVLLLPLLLLTAACNDSSGSRAVGSSNSAGRTTVVSNPKPAGHATSSIAIAGDTVPEPSAQSPEPEDTGAPDNTAKIPEPTGMSAVIALGVSAMLWHRNRHKYLA